MTLASVRRHRAFAVMASAAVFLLVPFLSTAQEADSEEGHWVDTWAASPQPDWGADFPFPVALPRSLADQTIRQVARVSLGGDRLRVEFSNEYGDVPLVIGEAHVALANEDGTIVPGTDQLLTFSGLQGVEVPPGAPIWSDAVDLPVEALGSVAVSLYLPQVAPVATFHSDARQTAIISGPGNFAGAETFEAAQTFASRFFLSGLSVEAGPEARSVVVFGDSITDGTASTTDVNARYPDNLAERLIAAGAEVSVVNEGISGARVLRSRWGDNALARFDRDVLSHPHVDTVILMMGINDLGWAGTPFARPGEPSPTAEDIIVGYQQLIDRAHTHDIRVIGATLTPFENTFGGAGAFANYYTEDKEAQRQAVNEWIRTSGAFDGVVDYDEVLRDPENLGMLRPEFDSGDHLHPNDAGYVAMAEAIDLAALGVSQ